jgi:hypothetical protein
VNVGLIVRVGQIVRVACSVVVHVLMIGYRVSLVVVVDVCVTGGGIIVVTKTSTTVVAAVKVCVAGGGMIVEMETSVTVLVT